MNSWKDKQDRYKPKETSSVASTIPAKAACLCVIRDGPAYDVEREESSESEEDSISIRSLRTIKSLEGGVDIRFAGPLRAGR